MSDEVSNKTEKKLPDGWRWVALGEICTEDRRAIDGKSDEVSAIPYLSLENIESGSGRIVFNANSHSDIQGISNGFRFGPKHVLYGKLRPYLNKVALPDFAGRCTTEAIPILSKPEIDREFLAWTFRRPETVDWAMAEKTGSRMPRANMKHLMNFEFPLPPLAKQKKIVAVLNEKMAAVEKARAAALDRVEAIRALPSAFLREVFSLGDGELQDGWQWVVLGEICTEDRRAIDGKSDEVSAIPYLSLENIESGSGRIVFNANSNSDIQGISNGFRFGPKHVLYGKLRPYLNKVALPDFAGRCTTEAIPILPKPEIDREFLAWTFRRSETVDWAMAEKTGSRMPRANMKHLMNFEFPLPPLAEQKRIAATLNEKMAVAKKARAAAEAQLEAITALPSALLRQAFNGAL